jgi:hypothetical protein
LTAGGLRRPANPPAGGGKDSGCAAPRRPAARAAAPFVGVRKVIVLAEVIPRKEKQSLLIMFS